MKSFILSIVILFGGTMMTNAQDIIQRPNSYNYTKGIDLAHLHTEVKQLHGSFTFGTDSLFDVFLECLSQRGHTEDKMGLHLADVERNILQRLHWCATHLHCCSCCTNRHHNVEAHHVSEAVVEHKEETNTLNSIINTAHRWYPDFAHLLRLERLAKQIGLSAMEFAELIKGRIVNFTGRLFSSEHNRWFATDNTPLQILRDNDKRLTLTANRIPLSQWFNEQYDKLRQSIRQPIQPKKSRGMKL